VTILVRGDEEIFREYESFLHELRNTVIFLGRTETGTK
jgi:hypothetical protein